MQQRGEVASSFFVIAYVAFSLPVIGEGVLAEAAGLRTVGIAFAGVVALLSAAVSCYWRVASPARRISPAALSCRTSRPRSWAPR